MIVEFECFSFNKGKHKFKVSVNRQTFNLFSPKRKVHIDNKFVADLDKEG